MKNIFRIIVIVFVIVSIYLARNDIKTFINILGSYFSNTQQQSNSKNIPTVEQKITTKPVTAVSTPGPLKVAKNIFNEAVKAEALSIAGVVDITNQERIKNGNLKPLQINSKLNQSAKLKLDDMFKKQYFEHVSPDGKNIADLANAVGYEYIIIGENLALGNFASNKELVDAWMASPGHRANILNPKYQEIGVAVGRGNFEGREVWLAVQHFAMPLSACPAIDQDLKNKIETNKTESNILADQIDALKNDLDSKNQNSREYRDEVDQYNSLVRQYNDLINQTKIYVNEYNSEVSAFNSCAGAAA